MTDSTESDAAKEAAFFSKYAHIYTEPEVVWLERIIDQTGYPLSPSVIAHAVLRAGYVRSSTAEAAR